MVARWQRSTPTIDANGNRTTSVYHSCGIVVANINQLGLRTTFVHDAASQRIALVDPNSNRTSFSFDPVGNQTRITDPLNRRTTFAYDAANQQTLRIDARGFKTSYIYDNAGSLTNRRYPDASRATFVYDPTNNRTLASNPSGRYTAVFDNLNRLSAHAMPTGRITYQFDPISNRKMMEVSGAGRYTYQYDNAGQVTSVRTPFVDGARITMGYDNAGRKLSERLVGGVRSSYSYDLADRVTRLANVTSASVTLLSNTYKYDNVGNKTSAEQLLAKPTSGSDAGRITWTYDAAYQLTREQRNGASTTLTWDNSYVYDSRGNRLVKKAKIPASAAEVRTTSTYDAASQLQKTITGSARTTFIYDNTGSMTSQIDGATTRTTYTWDYERLNTVVAKSTTNRFTQTYNPDFFRVEATDNTGTEKWLINQDGANTAHTATDGARAELVTTPYSRGPLIIRRSSATSSLFYDALGNALSQSNSNATITRTAILDFFLNNVYTKGTAWQPMVGKAMFGTWTDAISGLLAMPMVPMFLPAAGVIIQLPGNCIKYCDPPTQQPALPIPRPLGLWRCQPRPTVQTDGQKPRFSESFDEDGAECTQTCRIKVTANRCFHESVAAGDDRDPSKFFTVFQVEFIFENRECCGVPMKNWTSYVNGCELYPGRLVYMGSDLGKAVRSYLATLTSCSEFDLTAMCKAVSTVNPPNPVK